MKIKFIESSDFFYASQFNQNGLIPVKLLNAKEIHKHFKGNKIVRLLAINGKRL